MWVYAYLREHYREKHCQVPLLRKKLCFVTPVVELGGLGRSITMILQAKPTATSSTYTHEMFTNDRDAGCSGRDLFYIPWLASFRKP